MCQGQPAAVFEQVSAFGNGPITRPHDGQVPSFLEAPGQRAAVDRLCCGMNLRSLANSLTGWFD